MLAAITQALKKGGTMSGFLAEKGQQAGLPTALADFEDGFLQRAEEADARS